MPRRDAVVALDHAVQEQAHMLHHPRDDRVIDGDVLVNPGLQAKFQCTKQAADHPHPNNTICSLLIYSLIIKIMNAIKLER